MHDTDKIEVTRQQALDWMGGAMRNWAHVPRINDDDIEDVRVELQRFAQIAVEAATREKDAEIERLYNLAKANNALARCLTAERDQLRAKLDEAVDCLHDAICIIGHLVPMDAYALAGRKLVARDAWQHGRDFLASAPEPEPVQKMHELPDEASIKHMVDRFLGWRLPADFSPDGGIIFSHTSGGHANAPTGTNLFTAAQAEAMVRYMMEVAHDR